MAERVVILGVGLHPFGCHPEKSVGELAHRVGIALDGAWRLAVASQDEDPFLEENGVLVAPRN